MFRGVDSSRVQNQSCSFNGNLQLCWRNRIHSGIGSKITELGSYGLSFLKNSTLRNILKCLFLCSSWQFQGRFYHSSWLRIKKYSTGKLFISRQSITLLKESNSFGTRIGSCKAWKIRTHYVCKIRVVIVHVFRAVFVIDSVAARRNSEHES